MKKGQEKENWLYNTLVDGIKNRIGLYSQEYIDLSGLNLSAQKDSDDRKLLKRAYRQAISDHPEYFYANKSYSIKPGSDGRIMGIMPSYFDFAREPGAIDRCQAEIDAAVDEALRQAEGITEPVETLLNLYDYFGETCVYNWETATKQIKKAPQSCWSAYSALCTGNTVCRGIAMAFQIVLDRLNNPHISCKVIASEKLDHVWNLVKLDGEWYHMDVNKAINHTPTLKGKCPHTGFLFSDEKSKILRQGGYQGWQETMLFEVPACSSTKYDEGWAFDGVDFPMYRENNRYSFVKKIGYRKYALFSGTLSGEVQKQADLPLLTYEFEGKNGKYFRMASGIIWLDGCLYYVNSEKALVQYCLADGTDTILGAISFEMQPSPDKFYKETQDGIGLYFDKSTKEIVTVSRTCRNELARFPKK